MELLYGRHECLIMIIDAKINALPESPFSSTFIFFYPDEHKTRLSESEFKVLVQAIEGNFEYADGEAFTVLLRQYMHDSGIRAPKLYTAALIEKSYFYQIFNGKHVPSRDTAIRIALALRLSLNESVRLLKTLGYCFFGKSRRDVIIMECVEYQAELYTTELLLNKYGEASLCNKSILLSE